MSHLWRKPDFCLQEVIYWRLLLVSTSPFSCWTPSGTDPRRPYACWFYQLTYVLILLILRALFSWYPPYPLVLTLFPSPLWRLPWSPRRDFNGDICLRTECSKVSNSLHVVWLWVSIFVFFYYRRKYLWSYINFHSILLQTWQRKLLHPVLLNQKEPNHRNSEFHLMELRKEKGFL